MIKLNIKPAEGSCKIFYAHYNEVVKFLQEKGINEVSEDDYKEICKALQFMIECDDVDDEELKEEVERFVACGGIYECFNNVSDKLNQLI